MKGKHFAKANWSRTRIVSVILSIALLFGCITFTSAWLIAENEEGPVVNKFTGSQLEITLTPDEDQGPYKLIPGMTYDLGDKAPEVTVEADSVECYLFAVLIEDWGVNRGSDSTDKSDYYFAIDGVDSRSSFLFTNSKDMQGHYGNTSTYSVMYFRSQDDINYIEASEQDQEFTVINKLSVPVARTKQDVSPSLFGETPPKFTVEVYSIQTLGFKGKHTTGNATEDAKADLQAAWEVVKEAIESDNTKHVVLN